MSDDEFRNMLAAVSAEFRQGLPARIAAIDGLWVRVTGGDPEAMTELIRALHTLAGSAETFGLADVGNAAAAAESGLEPHRDGGRVPDAAAQPGITRLLDALRRAADEVTG